MDYAIDAIGGVALLILSVRVLWISHPLPEGLAKMSRAVVAAWLRVSFSTGFLFLGIATTLSAVRDAPIFVEAPVALGYGLLWSALIWWDRDKIRSSLSSYESRA